MAIQIDREALIAGWRRMDATAAAKVLESTTWSHLTGDHQPARLASEALGGWEDGAEPPELMPTERRASVVAAKLLSHDPRFASGLQRLLAEPFSDDFQEFVSLLIQTAAEAGAVYAKHFDSDPPMALDRLVRATGALLGVELLPDPELVLISSERASNEGRPDGEGRPGP